MNELGKTSTLGGGELVIGGNARKDDCSYGRKEKVFFHKGGADSTFRKLR